MLVGRLVNPFVVLDEEPVEDLKVDGGAAEGSEGQTPVVGEHVQGRDGGNGVAGWEQFAAAVVDGGAEGRPGGRHDGDIPDAVKADGRGRSLRRRWHR